MPRPWRAAACPLLLYGVGLALLLGALLEKRGPRVPERPIPAHAYVRQWNPRACGPACVATLLSTYGRPWTPDELERRCRLGARGSSLADLAAACRQYGLRARAWRATRPAALRRLPRPFLAHLAEGHFVVVGRLQGSHLEVFDPTTGRLWRWSWEELFARSQGWALEVRP